MDGAPDYFLGTYEKERLRLIAQAEMHAPETAAVLDEIGVGPGWHAVDVGCGPLGILDLLAARVGSEGTVVGLDQSEQMLRAAEQTVRDRNLGNVRLMQALGDATGRESESFDLVHERLVLINVSNPQDLLEEMIRLTKPGGWVIAQEYDWISLACSPSNASWDRLEGAIRAVWGHSGYDVGIGRRLPSMVTQLGLTDVQVRAYQRVWRYGDVFHGFAHWVAVMLRDRILQHHDISASELDASIADAAQHLAHPGTISLHPLHVQVWGRKPQYL